MLLQLQKPLKVCGSLVPLMLASLVYSSHGAPTSRLHMAGNVSVVSCMLRRCTHMPVMTMVAALFIYCAVGFSRGNVRRVVTVLGVCEHVG
jgi:hypothetical protein